MRIDGGDDGTLVTGADVFKVLGADVNAVGLRV